MSLLITNVTTLVVGTWIRDKLIKNKQWFRVRESVIDMPCQTTSTDLCSNIGEKIGEVDQVLLQVHLV